MTVDRDVTTHERAAEATRDGARRLAEAQRVARLGSWEWDVATGTVTWSDELYRLNGRDLALPAPSYAELSTYYTPEAHAQLVAAVQRALETGAAYDLELETIHPDGSTWWQAARAEAERDAAGRVVRLRGTVQDITERKHAEAARDSLQAQLALSQKMEAVGQLAGGVAHDFNNILAAMIVQLDMLRQTPVVPPDELRSAVDELLRSAHRAADLTRQLLLFGRRQAMTTARHDLSAVVLELSKLLERVLGENIRLVVERPDEPLWFDGDAGMIEQVVSSLCVNARDAMPAGGTLTLATIAVEHEVALRVTDTGCGMEPAVLEHLFEPFFTTKGPGRGTGLGLATVHGIVAKHGGRVEVDSAVGRGTTFRVFLPRAAPPEQAAVRLEAASIPGGTESILVVEDEAALRRAAVRCLRRLGYRVVEAANGVDALRVWEQEEGRVDLLLTDMVMPEGMSGLELCERLRKQTPDLPTIVASGYSAEIVDDAAAVAAQRVTFLSKPYDMSTLAAAVRACLTARPARQ